jgi:hypothetical protein
MSDDRSKKNGAESNIFQDPHSIFYEGPVDLDQVLLPPTMRIAPTKSKRRDSTIELQPLQ